MLHNKLMLKYILNHNYLIILIQNLKYLQNHFPLISTTSVVNARLSVNRDMVKHFEALGLLTTPVMFMLYQPTSQLLH